MTISRIYEKLQHIALEEFNEIVVQTEIQRLPTGDPRKLRLFLLDDSFIDIFISVTGRYSYHWSRINAENGAIYRHDNAPHKVWRSVATYPKHFHNGSEKNVIESAINDQPTDAVREFCRFVSQKLQEEASRK